MSETYLPIRESVAYKNIRESLQQIFYLDLNSMPIREGEDENFAFDFTYKNTEVNIIVSATGKSGQFNVGEGGLVSIFFPNPDYPVHSFLSKKSIENIVDDEQIRFRLRYLSGKRKSDIKLAFQLLKDYLDQKCEEGGPSLK